MEDGGEAWQDEQDKQEKAWSAKWEMGTKDWGERVAQAMEDVSPRLHEQAGAVIAANRAIERQFKKKEEKQIEDSRAFSRGVAQVREEIARERKAAKGGPSRRRKAAGEGLARLTASEKSQPVPEQLLEPQTETSETPSYNVRLISEGKFWNSSEAAKIFLNEDKLVVKIDGEDMATMNYNDIDSFGPRKGDKDKKNKSTMRIDSRDGSKIKIEFYSRDGRCDDYYDLKNDLESKTPHVQRHGGGKKSRRKSKRKNKKYTKRRKTTKRKYTKRRKSKTRRRRR